MFKEKEYKKSKKNQTKMTGNIYFEKKRVIKKSEKNKPTKL